MREVTSPIIKWHFLLLILTPRVGRGAVENAAQKTFTNPGRLRGELVLKRAFELDTCRREWTAAAARSASEVLALWRVLSLSNSRLLQHPNF